MSSDCTSKVKKLSFSFQCCCCVCCLLVKPARLDIHRGPSSAGVGRVLGRGGESTDRGGESTGRGGESTGRGGESTVLGTFLSVVWLHGDVEKISCAQLCLRI